jgi:hypothetical protein
MYYFMIKAHPVDPSEEDEGALGAYVSCWIDFKAQDGAQVLAEHYIRSQGWEPREIEDVQLVTRADYVDDEENLVFFDEAARDGTCFVYQLWMGEDEGDDFDSPLSGRA